MGCGGRGLRGGVGDAVDLGPGQADALVDAPQDGHVVEQRALRRRGGQVGDDLVPGRCLLLGQAGVGRTVVGLVTLEAETRRDLVLDVDVLEEHVPLGRRELVVDLDGIEHRLGLLVGLPGRVQITGLHRRGVGLERRGQGLAPGQAVGSVPVGPGESQAAERRRPQHDSEPDKQRSIAGITGHYVPLQNDGAARPIPRSEPADDAQLPLRRPTVPPREQKAPIG